MITACFLTMTFALGLGDITGTVLDSEGRPVQGAIVTVLDGETGVPVSRETWQPFVEGDDDMEDAMAAIAFVSTDASGAFGFDGLPAGDFRLIAQSWIANPSPESVLSVNGPAVHLRGNTTVRVEPEGTSTVEIRPLGNAILVLDDHAPNDETLVVLSTQPLPGDPALGFLVWPGPFLESAIGFNRMPGGATVFRGLPEGEVHVAVFSADNNGGHGGATVRVNNQAPTLVNVPFITMWSDGVHTPPPQLAELTERVSELPSAQRNELLSEFMALLTIDRRPDGSANSASVTRGVAAASTRTIEVAEGDEAIEAPFLDVAAALRYAALRDRVRSQGRNPNPWREPVTRPATPRDIVESLGGPMNRR